MTTSPITSPLKILWAGNWAGRAFTGLVVFFLCKFRAYLHQKKTTSPITSPVKALPARLPAHRAGREGHRAGIKKISREKI